MTTLANVVSTVSEHFGLSKSEVEKVLKQGFETIKSEVAVGNEVSIPGFGKFSTTERAARVGRNPATGEEIQIAASTSVKFKAASLFKNAL